MNELEFLSRVSHTFALTIPQLPAELCSAVTNAYLILRLADTIEDEPAFTYQQLCLYERSYLAVVTGQIDAQCFSDEVGALLTEQTPKAERDLLQHLVWVMQANSRLRQVQREAIADCLSVMAKGMIEFRRDLGLKGLATRHDLDRYCYCVSGVVGEMLTTLFIDFEPALAAQRSVLSRLSVSLGAALQLTNILKDQWEDRQRGICWLPQDLFSEHSVQLLTLQAGQKSVDFDQALAELIGTAHAHLQLGLEYALLIPVKHEGLRRFILWTIGLTLLTLYKIHAHRGFSSEQQVKISHLQVALMTRLTRASQRSNSGLRALFKFAARQLPLTPLDAQWQEASYSVRPWPRSSIDFLGDPPSNPSD